MAATMATSQRTLTCERKQPTSPTLIGFPQNDFLLSSCLSSQPSRLYCSIGARWCEMVQGGAKKN
jgi:hypothetical protein